MEPVPVGEHGVDEGARDVDPASAGLQHPLHELLHLRGGQHQVGQLVAAVACDEDPARVVDPDLLDGGVVEERLERPEAGDPGDQLAHHGVDVGHGCDRTGQGVVVVLAHHALGDPSDQAGVALRVDALTAYVGANPLVEALDERYVRVGDRHAGPRPE